MKNNYYIVNASWLFPLVYKYQNADLKFTWTITPHTLKVKKKYPWKLGISFYQVIIISFTW